MGGGLSKDAAEFGFARVRRLAGLFPLPALRLGHDHGYAGTVDLDIENRNAGSDHDRQCQVFGTADLLLLSREDVPANGFRGTLYGFGRYRQICQIVLVAPARG